MCAFRTLILVYTTNSSDEPETLHRNMIRFIFETADNAAVLHICHPALANGAARDSKLGKGTSENFHL